MAFPGREVKFILLSTEQWNWARQIHVMETRFYSTPRIAFKGIRSFEESLPRRSRGPTGPATPDRGSQAGGGDPEPRRNVRTPAVHPGSPGSAARGGAAGVPGAPAPAGLRRWTELSSMLATVGSLRASGPRAIPAAPRERPQMSSGAGRVSRPRGHPQTPVAGAPGRSEPPGSGEQGWERPGRDGSVERWGWRMEARVRPDHWAVGLSVTVYVPVAFAAEKVHRVPAEHKPSQLTRESCCGPGVSKRWRISRPDSVSVPGRVEGPLEGPPQGLEGSGSTHLPTRAHRGRERCAEPHGFS